MKGGYLHGNIVPSFAARLIHANGIKKRMINLSLMIDYIIIYEKDPYLAVSTQSVDKPYPMRNDCNFYIRIQPKKIERRRE